jgi:hypothetical protein
MVRGRAKEKESGSRGRIELRSNFKIQLTLMVSKEA